jgi:Flp pilus assembly protein TadB
MTSTVIGYILLGVAAFFVLIGNLIIQRMTALES